jgi:hypothetical protein
MLADFPNTKFLEVYVAGLKLLFVDRRTER